MSKNYFAPHGKIYSYSSEKQNNTKNYSFLIKGLIIFWKKYPIVILDGGASWASWAMFVLSYL